MTMFEGRDLKWAAELCEYLNANPSPLYGDYSTEVQVEFFFEGEPTGLTLKLDGFGETYVLELSERATDNCAPKILP